MSNIALRNTPLAVTQAQSGSALPVTGSFNGTAPNAGDLIICCYSEAGGGSVIPAPPAQSSGYTEGGHKVQSSSKCAWWYAVADGSDSPPVVTPASGFTGSICAVVYILSGAESGAPTDIIDISASISGTTGLTLNPSTSPAVSAQVDFGFSVYARFNSAARFDTLTSDTSGWTNDFMSSGSQKHTHHFASVHSPYVNNFAFQHNTATFTGASTQECAMLACILPVPPSDADTGTGIDAGEKVAVRPAGDAGTGIDAGESIHATASSGDAGTGTEAQSTGHSSSDASSVTADAGSVTHATASDADTAAGIDSGLITHAAFSSPDAGTGIDAGESIHATASSGDAGTGADASTKVAPLASDSGTGNDAGEQTVIKPAGDTGHGTDGGEIAQPLMFSSSDAGTGIDASASIRPPAQADAGSGADSGTVHVTLSSPDNGTGTEAQSAIRPANDADTGTGIDSGTTVSISQLGVNGDFCNAVFSVLAVSDTDTGTGDDEISGPGPAVLDADAGTANDAGISIGPHDADACLGTELLDWHIGTHDADTAHGTDPDGTRALPVSSSDTASANDASTLAVTLRDADSATGNDAGQVTRRTLRDADAGTAADAQSATFAGTQADSGTGTESPGAVGISSADAATGTEASSPVRVTGTDAGTGAENQGAVNLFRFSADQGAGTDSGQATRATRADSDGARASERQDATVPQFSDFMLESQGFSHAAILSGSAGLETAELYGCRSATVSLSYDTWANTADDTDTGAWHAIRSAQVTVTAGFISWQALSGISGVPVSGPDGAQRYGLSIWREFTGTAPVLPVILAAPARDLHFAPELSWHDIAGGPRSLGIVLYAVRLGGFSIDGVSYKAGITFSYTGVAVPSSVDEAGSPLPGSYYGNGAGLSIGRILSSPGSAGATLPVTSALFAQGT